MKPRVRWHPLDCEDLPSRAPLELAADPRPGRRFEPTVEKSLNGDLVTLAMNLPSASRGLAITREFPGGRGVADIVAVTRWHGALRTRLSMPQPFLRDDQARVIATSLPKRALRCDRCKKNWDVVVPDCGPARHDWRDLSSLQGTPKQRCAVCGAKRSSPNA